MKILAVTSGRADATPLDPVIKATGAHPLYVGDVGFSGAALRVEGWLDKPDLMLLLGDRFETLAACGVATVAKIPIAHIHGGEASFGSFDNQIRDAITKLAHIHFVAAEPMKQRLFDLGEEEHRIHVVGAPGLDNLVGLRQREPEKYFIVTYHPATLEKKTGVHELIAALKAFPRYKIIWTSTNNDPGADEIREAVRGCPLELLNIPCGEVRLEEYVRLCRHAAAVVGNSSSGIIEAPTLEVPTVNVGSRQDGRLKGPSIFDCAEDRSDIENALHDALEYDGPFDNPYGGPGASEKIADILRMYEAVEIDMRKEWRS